MNEQVMNAGSNVRNQKQLLFNVVVRISTLEHYLIMLEENPKFYVNCYEHSLNDLMLDEDKNNLIGYIRNYLMGELEECYRCVKTIAHNLDKIEFDKESITKD